MEKYKFINRISCRYCLAFRVSNIVYRSKKEWALSSWFSRSKRSWILRSISLYSADATNLSSLTQSKRKASLPLSLVWPRLLEVRRKRRKFSQLQRERNTSTRTSSLELYLTSLLIRTELFLKSRNYVRQKSAKVEESLWLLIRTDSIVEAAIQLCKKKRRPKHQAKNDNKLSIIIFGY